MKMIHLHYQVNIEPHMMADDRRRKRDLSPVDDDNKRRKLHSYTLEFKLNAISEVKKGKSKEATARKFGVAPKRIREWYKQEEKLKAMASHSSQSQRKRLDGGGRRPLLDTLEERVYEWIESMRSRRLRVTRKMVKREALKIFSNEGGQDYDSNPEFVASNGWLRNFFNRYRITLRQKTTEEEDVEATAENELGVDEDDGFDEKDNIPLAEYEEAGSLQERFSATILKSGLVKEEQGDKYGVTEKTENIFVTMKTEQSDLTQSEVMSKFSKSTVDDLDCSKCGLINVKIETGLQDVQCVDSRFESTSDVKSSVDISYGSQFPENYVLKQEVHGKANLTGNNIKQSGIPQDGDKAHSYVTCGIESVTVYNLKEHKRTPTRDNLYNSELNKQIHTGEKLHSCVVCGKHCRTNTELNIHQRIHLGEKDYSCADCGKEFKTNSGLKKHEKIHNDVKPYCCAMCEKHFRTNTELKIHQRIHTGEKPYSCDFCGKQFGNNCNLKKHERIHTGERPYTCVVCNKQFTTTGALKYHKRIHTGEKPYSCGICGKDFKRNGELKMHQRIHTGEKPYSCAICGKNFRTNGDLKMHQMIHTGEKPYSCDFCGKQFGSNCNLKKHERIHTGVKPYTCVVCNKQFTTNSALKYHKRIHTGEKP